MIKFPSAVQLRLMLIFAENAHKEYEKILGRKDEDWAAWYANYIYRQKTEYKELVDAATHERKSKSTK